jgi:hypothetical protein
VDFLEESLAMNVAQEMREPDHADIHTRLERAFLWTDIASKQMGIHTSGATVAVALVKVIIIVVGREEGESPSPTFPSLLILFTH